MPAGEPVLLALRPQADPEHAAAKAWWNGLLDGEIDVGIPAGGR